MARQVTVVIHAVRGRAVLKYCGRLAFTLTLLTMPPPGVAWRCGMGACTALCACMRRAVAVGLPAGALAGTVTPDQGCKPVPCRKASSIQEA
jgi:hypothetical protein